MNIIRTNRSFTIQSLTCASLVTLLAIADLPAVTSQTWRQRERAEFEKGEPEGVSLSVDGALRLSPPMELLHETPQPYVWAIARDPSGAIYVAGGNDGTIYRILGKGNAEEFYRIDEPEVSALAVGPDRFVYAGSVPGGRIYRIPPDGAEAWASETKEEYIWSLVVDPGGKLYAGTGLEGRVLQFDPEGNGRVLFDSAETHIRAIRLDREGNLIAGSDGHGLVYRIAKDGDPFVLYDAPLDEIASLALGNDGTIYAAVIGQRGRSRERKAPPSTPPQPKAPPPGEQPPSDDSEKKPAADSSQAPKEQRMPISMEGKVLAISDDGYAREIWSGEQEAIFCLETAPDGRLLMGSSLQGRIYAYDPADDSVREIARSPSGQITALLAVGGRADRSDRAKNGPADPGDVIVGGSNLGTVALLRQGFASSGAYRSRVLDARSFATWGRLSWKAEMPRGTSIAISARTGNTEEPDPTWSGWSEPLPEPAGSILDRPSARFMQWRATLTSSNPERTPVLREVSVTYLQRNLPPEIRKIEVQAPGISFRKVPDSGSRGPSEAGSAAASNRQDGGARHSAPTRGRRGFDPGARSVTWQADDPNNDALRYDVYFRAVDEKTWKPVRTRIEEPFVTMDSTAMPDGTYQFRVVASDATSNPEGEALTTETLSSPFDVDNTPPRVEGLNVSVRSEEIRVVFATRDTFSLIREVAYSIDAGEWVPATPVDGMHDSPEERYELVLPSPTSGEHTLVVRATDASGNVGASRAVFEVP